MLDRYDPMHEISCFSRGFPRSCERSEAILGMCLAYRQSAGACRVPAAVKLRRLMDRFGGDPHGKRNAHFDNYKAQRSLQDTLRNWPLPSDFGGTAMYPRRFTRVRPTGRNSDVAKLIVDPKAPVIDCRVVDYSPGGACLEISGQTKLPNRFELLFGGTRKRCRIVWSAGRRLGVVF
jgi:hypothetical protein